MAPQPWPGVSADEVPWLTTDDMIEVDRVMIDDLGIELKQMMENAGRNLADVVQRLVHPASVCVVAGSGGNGGGGLVAARHLANRGAKVHVVLSRPVAEMRGVPAQQQAILQQMGVPMSQAYAEVLASSDVIVDALIGYSLRGAPRGVARDLIDAMNAAAAPVVSLDVPSGVDSTTGNTVGNAVSANATLTLAAPKRGLRNSESVGRLFLGDISVPPSVYAGMGLVPPTFTGGAWIVEVTR